MKLSTKFYIFALATSAALPAAAQVGPDDRSRMDQRSRDAELQSDPPAKRATATTATTSSGRKLVVSRGAEKQIIALQAAVSANDTATIPAKLAAAQAAAKTPDDKFLVGTMQTTASQRANDVTGLSSGLELMQASGLAETADLVAGYTDLARRYREAKRLDDAVTALNKAMALNPNNAATLITFASVRDAQGQKAEALALMQKSFAASKAAGVKVDEGNYKFAAGLALAQRLPVTNDIARQWVAAYPSTVSWRDSMRIYRDISKPTGSQLIDIMRLGRATNSLGGEGDYFALANALAASGKLAEAKAVMADAKSAPGVDLTKAAFVQLNARLAGAPTRAAIDASAKTALAGANGKAMIDAGDALYGIGAYAEAVPLYRAALSKGGDASLANLHLGMALARSGDKAGATAALRAVTGVNAEVAQYWLLWTSPSA